MPLQYNRYNFLCLSNGNDVTAEMMPTYGIYQGGTHAVADKIAFFLFIMESVNFNKADKKLGSVQCLFWLYRAVLV
jgi:hypothetical protein